MTVKEFVKRFIRSYLQIRLRRAVAGEVIKVAYIEDGNLPQELEDCADEIVAGITPVNDSLLTIWGRGLKYGKNSYY